MAGHHNYRGWPAIAASLLVLTACRTTPEGEVTTPPVIETAAPTTQTLTPVPFAALGPGWAEADLSPAIEALIDACADAALAPRLWPEQPREAVADACASLTADPSRAGVEVAFSAYEARAINATSRLTGYYEPVVEVRSAPETGFEAPVPGLTPDMVRMDLGLLDPVRAGQTRWGRLLTTPNAPGRVLPLPPRAEVRVETALGWADPVEVFFLQVQGSGRLVFPDGQVIRAAFAAHNDRPFVSLARYLIAEGELPQSDAHMAGLKAWLRRVGPERAQAAMYVNPRFVWFAPEVIADPTVGPRGSLGQPLRPLAHVAMDPAFAPPGSLWWLGASVPQASGNWQGLPWQGLVMVADTGGAIKGPLRADLYFGTGAEAGSRAGVTNSQLSGVLLVPRGVACTEAWQAAHGAPAQGCGP